MKNSRVLIRLLPHVEVRAKKWRYASQHPEESSLLEGRIEAGQAEERMLPAQDVWR